MSLYSPMSGDNWGSLITVDGHDTGERLTASWNRVTPDYFETIGTPVLRGRGFTDRDRPGAPLVTVVNQAFAARFFGESDPIGRRIGFARERTGGVREFEIVGVVGDAKYQDAKVPAYRTFFLPFLQRSAASTIGASPGAVLKTVLRGALVQLAAGLLIGMPAALAAGRLLQAMLYGVSGQDPWLLTLAVVILAVCAIAAGLIPARRAAALDPVRALRVE